MKKIALLLLAFVVGLSAASIAQDKTIYYPGKSAEVTTVREDMKIKLLGLRQEVNEAYSSLIGLIVLEAKAQTIEQSVKGIKYRITVVPMDEDPRIDPKPLIEVAP